MKKIRNLPYPKPSAAMVDHAPRLLEKSQRAKENAAMEAAEKRLTPLFWIIILCCAIVLVGLRAYDAGHASARHECPPRQQGERLLSTEQHRDMTVCTYAEGAAGYGHTIKRRGVKS